MFHKNQMGFTLIELMLAIAISGVITGGITMTIFSVVNGNIRSTNHMTAVRQVQNAGYWINHDALMTQGEPVIGDDPAGTGFPLTLTWAEWDSGDEYTVIYSIGNNKLQREKYINGGLSGAPYVFEYIINTDPDTGELKTYCDFTDGALVFKVTAMVGEQSETRIYEVVPRPGS